MFGPTKSIVLRRPAAGTLELPEDPARDVPEERAGLRANRLASDRRPGGRFEQPLGERLHRRWRPAIFCRIQSPRPMTQARERNPLTSQAGEPVTSPPPAPRGAAGPRACARDLRVGHRGPAPAVAPPDLERRRQSARRLAWEPIDQSTSVAGSTRGAPALALCLLAGGDHGGGRALPSAMAGRSLGRAAPRASRRRPLGRSTPRPVSGGGCRGWEPQARRRVRLRRRLVRLRRRLVRLRRPVPPSQGPVLVRGGSRGGRSRSCAGQRPEPGAVAAAGTAAGRSRSGGARPRRGGGGRGDRRRLHDDRRGLRQIHDPTARLPPGSTRSAWTTRELSSSFANLGAYRM